ncbi:unnamed protein product [Schistosoma curassoni]|uniref:Uncharacterized protein n=1 Tax=Schistosoma curassoni TaxID=6186 RepID=A0A183KCB1_9TREM|nr:unnamed protein product [Schistosoma curassoni]
MKLISCFNLHVKLIMMYRIGYLDKFSKEILKLIDKIYLMIHHGLNLMLNLP